MSTFLKAYPLATKAREVIPHDVAQPLGCFMLSVAAQASLLINQLPVAPMVAVSCQEPVLLYFTTAATAPIITGGNFLEGAMYCPPGTTVLATPETRRVWVYNLGDRADIVSVQLLQSWNSLGVDQQLSRI